MHESGARNRIELKLHKSWYNRKEEKVLYSFYQTIYAYCLYERNLGLKRISIITTEEEYRFKSYFSKILFNLASYFIKIEKILRFQRFLFPLWNCEIQFPSNFPLLHTKRWFCKVLFKYVIKKPYRFLHLRRFLKFYFYLFTSRTTGRFPC